MRTITAATAFILGGCMILAGCVVGDATGTPGIEPIPGSITYSGQPRSKLTKSPVGSTFSHYFFGPFGERIHETYVIMPDRSLKLIARERQDIFAALYDDRRR